MDEMMKYKVSVIVPVYNVERYLSACLTSLLDQTLPEIEIVCINDGSTDGSLEILKSFAGAHDNVKVISKENAGYGAALNDGIDAASGEYFGIVEPDDYVLPTMFERLYGIAKDNDLDLIKSDHYEFEGDSIEDKSTYVPLTRNNWYYGRVIDPSESPRVFNLNMVTCTGIYKLDWVRQAGIRYNETPGASYQDNGFWHQSFYFAHKVFFLNEAFYCYRQDNAASSTNSKSKSLAGRTEYEYIYQILKNHPEQYKAFIGIHTYRKFNNYMYNYNRIEESARKDFLDVFSKDFQQFERAGEIDWSYFNSQQKIYLKQIIADPLAFYSKDCGLPVVFATDDAYAPYAGVAIQSLIDHADSSKLYSVNILHTHLSEDNSTGLLELARDNVGINLIDVSALVSEWKIYSTAHYSEAMFYRIAIPRLFSNRSKVLYLDCDILIYDDVSKLFEFDLGASVVGAVRNICNQSRSRYVETVLGVDDDEYFNSGVILFNIESFISNCIEQRCCDLLSAYRRLDCPDQDILNLACMGLVTYLPIRWNVAWQHAIGPIQKYYDETILKQFSSALEDIGILHYTTAVKPWNTPQESLAGPFWLTAERTVFYEDILQRESMKELEKEKQAIVKEVAPKRKGCLLRRAVSHYKKYGAKKTIARVFKGR